MSNRGRPPYRARPPEPLDPGDRSPQRRRDPTIVQARL